MLLKYLLARNRDKISCVTVIRSLYPSHLGGISVPKLDVHFLVLSWNIVQETFSAKHQLFVEWKNEPVLALPHLLQPPDPQSPVPAECSSTWDLLDLQSV